MWALLLDILKALVTGDIKRLWQEHKEKEAQDAVNKDASLGDTAAIDRLRDKYTRS